MKYTLDIRANKEVSILGFGCMRFPRTLGQIDYDKSERLVIDAVSNGINYFDTAYIYMGSEEILGKIVDKNNLRDKIYIATKLPLSKCKDYADFDRLFYEQLKNLRTNYIDYYLMHNMCDKAQWDRLCDLGIEKWISQKKDSGEIKQIGFSFHGVKTMFPILIDAYDWDFVQIQYNYLNINYQAGQAGLRYAYSKGLPVIIMEPLLGGKLANSIPKNVHKLFKKENPEYTEAGWAFRWLYNQKEVSVVLSGMNAPEQLFDNIQVASNSTPNMLTEEELKTYDLVINEFNKLYKVNCTGCNYCMPCPHNVNIPANFSAYNMSYVMGRFSGLQQYSLSAKVFSKDNLLSSNCKHCKLCEKKCPQNINISQKMTDVERRMEPLLVKGAIKIFNKIR